MNRRSWTIEGLVGLAVGMATYGWLVADIALAATLAGVYAVATGLTLEHRSAIPFGTERPEGYDPWSGVWTAIVAFAALVGVGFWLPLAPGLRLALQLLVLGVGLVSLYCGIGLARSLPADERPDTDRVRAN
jgi:uncharacterized membrane protein YccF (DUF307 family)